MIVSYILQIRSNKQYPKVLSAFELVTEPKHCAASEITRQEARHCLPSFVTSLRSLFLAFWDSTYCTVDGMHVQSCVLDWYIKETRDNVRISLSHWNFSVRFSTSTLLLL